MKTKLLLLLPLIGLLNGCGFTEIEETHLVQATDDDGHVSYFKMTLKARSQTAKTEWRAGMYDAYALDSLFGDTEAGEATALDTSLARKRIQASTALYDQYLAALKDKNATPEQLADLERRFARSVESPYTVAQRGNGAPQRKYAIIYSSNASVVEEAIAGIVEEKETAQSLMMVFAQKERTAFIKAKSRAKNLEFAYGRLDALRQRIADAAKTGTLTPELAQEIAADLAALGVHYGD